MQELHAGTKKERIKAGIALMLCCESNEDENMSVIIRYSFGPGEKEENSADPPDRWDLPDRVRRGRLRQRKNEDMAGCLSMTLWQHWKKTVSQRWE